MSRQSPLQRALEAYPRSERVTKLSDPRVDRWRKLGLYQKARHQFGLFQVEGLRAVELLIDKGDFDIEALIVVSDELVLRQREIQERVAGVVRRVAERDTPIHDVTREIFRRVANVKKLRGVMAIARIGSWTIAELVESVGKESSLALATVGLTDPGNLGTLIRSAFAFGGVALFALEGTTDPYHSKVLRASAGHMLPCATGSWQELRAACERHGVELIGLQLAKASISLSDLPPGRECAEIVCVGSEGSGFPDHVRGFHHVVGIPMRSDADSLNAAVAGALLLWQRRRVE